MHEKILDPGISENTYIDNRRSVYDMTDEFIIHRTMGGYVFFSLGNNYVSVEPYEIAQ